MYLYTAGRKISIINMKKNILFIVFTGFLCAFFLQIAWAHGSLHEAGIAAYENGDYRAAADSFRDAVKSAPLDSRLHHWLGKCYGRIAEHGNWFTALRYAKKTLAQFRKAVELDETNYEALRDLTDYLEKAPGFMGGDRREAERLGQRLEAMRHASQAGDE